MRLLSLCLIVAACWGCTSTKYTCADVFSTKKEKLPLKYRIGKSSTPKRVENNQFDTLVKFMETPMIASIKPPVVSGTLPAERKLALESLIAQTDQLTFGKDELEATFDQLDHKQKRVLKKELKEKVKELKGGDDDEDFKVAKILGFISFGSSILTLLFFPLSIVGLVTGIISLNRYKKTTNKQYRIFGLLGVIFSSIWVLIGLLVIFLILLLFSSGWGY